MKKFVSSLCIVTILALPTSAYADDQTFPDVPKPVPGEIDVGAAISPLRKGQLAPFTGVLLSPKALASIITELNSISDQIKIEVDKTKAEDAANCDYRVAETENELKTSIKILDAQAEERKKQIDMLNDRLKQSEDDQPYTALWVGLGVGGGFLLGAVLTGVITYGVNQASK